MITLIVRKPDGKEEKFPLQDELVAGREGPIDILLKDAGVSRRHARFFLEGEEVMVEDLGSSNGVFVDGGRIDGPTPLPYGSVALLGDFEISLLPAGTAPRAKAPTRPAPGRAPRPAALAAAAPRGKSAAAPSRASTPPPSGRAPRALPASAGKSSGGKPGGPVLRGTSGPWAGQLFPLDKKLISVGRVPPNEIVLDDDSVSRAHAEVAQVGAGWVVRDLGSANGTMVNGAAIEEQPLKPGDLVRFGVVELAYSGPAGKSAPVAGEAGGGRKKLLLLVGVVLVLVVGAGVAKKALTPPEPDPSTLVPQGPDANEELKKREEEIARHQIRMKGFVEQSEWERALVEAEAIIDLDPINLDARKAKATAAREQGFKVIYDEGRRKKDLGQDEEALQRFFQIPKDSAYHGRARVEVNKLVKQVTPKLRGDCVGYYKANNYEKANEVCAQYLDFTCNEKIDTEVLKYRKFTETRVKKGGSVQVWQCPAALAHWFKVETSAADLHLRESMATTYPEPAIAEAIYIYAMEAKPKLAWDMLKKLRANDKYNRSFSLIDTVSEKLLIVDGKFADGQSAFLQDRMIDADAQWSIAMEKDKELMPPGAESALVKNIRSSLAQGWHKEGQKFKQRNQQKPAFAAFKKGFQASASNLDCRNAIQRLEVEADTLLGSAPGCSDIQLALAITMDGSPSHKKAEAAAIERGCK